MELEQLLSILKLICRNDAIRRGKQNSNEYEVILYRFGHWCYANKFDFNSIQSDIYSPNPTDSLVLQWFKHHHMIEIYNALVDIIINQTEQQQQENNNNNNNNDDDDDDDDDNKQHHDDHNNMNNYQSYSSSNGDDSDDQIIIDNQHQESHDIHNDIDNDDNNTKHNLSNAEYYYNNNYYDDYDLYGNAGSDNSYKFKVLIGNKTVTFSLYEFILSLQSLNLSTTNAVWQKIPKNEDDLIGDKQNLCLCIHILICISIQNKYKTVNNNNSNKYQSSSNNNQYNKFQTDPIYLKFLDDITCALCQYFLNRNARIKLTPNCLILRDNKSTSQIVMGFGDLVEELPKWLKLCNDIILSSNQ